MVMGGVSPTNRRLRPIVITKYRRSLLHQRHPVWPISAKSDLNFHITREFAHGSYREHYSSDSMGISLSNQTAALVPEPT